MAKCVKCERELKTNELGLYKRLIDREGKTPLCLTCMSEYFGCTEELLKEKIAQYVSQGCALFVDEK